MVMRMKFIHGDIKEYQTIHVLGQMFTCQVWVVQQLNYSILIDWTVHL